MKNSCCLLIWLGINFYFFFPFTVISLLVQNLRMNWFGFCGFAWKMVKLRLDGLRGEEVHAAFIYVQVFFCSYEIMWVCVRLKKWSVYRCVLYGMSECVRASALNVCAQYELTLANKYLIYIEQNIATLNNHTFNGQIFA